MAAEPLFPHGGGEEELGKIFVILAFCAFWGLLCFLSPQCAPERNRRREMSKNPSCEGWEHERARETLGRGFWLSSAPMVQHNIDCIPFPHDRSEIWTGIGVDFPQVKPKSAGSCRVQPSSFPQDGCQGWALHPQGCWGPSGCGSRSGSALPWPGNSHFSCKARFISQRIHGRACSQIPCSLSLDASGLPLNKGRFPWEVEPLLRIWVRLWSCQSSPVRGSNPAQPGIHRFSTSTAGCGWEGGMLE